MQRAKPIPHFGSSEVDLTRLSLAELVRALGAGDVTLDVVLSELRGRPCLDSTWRPGDAVPPPAKATVSR